MKKERKNFITDETIIEGDEEILKIKIEELSWRLFVDYVNKKYDSTVLELNI